MNIAEMNRDFIVAAYSVMWVVVLGYLTRLVIKGSRTTAEYERMKRESGQGT